MVALASTEIAWQQLSETFPMKENTAYTTLAYNMLKISF